MPEPGDRSGRPRQLHDLLSSAVAETTAEGILLSGGLDTSIVATLAASEGRRLRAFTLCVKDAPSPDEEFADLMSRRLGLKQQVLRPTLEELAKRMSDTIRLLTTFDPMELTNSIVTMLGLEAARDAGVQAVLTGDAADELFAGYSFMFNLPEDEIPLRVRQMEEHMRFTSIPLGEVIGVKAELPFTSGSVRKFVLGLDAADLVGERDGAKFGKRILREAFSGDLPAEITWRVKTPIEYGSGSTALRQYVTDKVPDDAFGRECERALREDGVKLREKQQSFYYEEYRKWFPPPRELPTGEKTCGECCGPVDRSEMRFCRICGAFPI